MYNLFNNILKARCYAGFLYGMHSCLSAYVETAKANGLNVYKYLEFLITELSERKKDGSLDHIDDLLVSTQP